jgi:hypothetical protein
MYGIDGYSSTIANSYTGNYIVEVDTWNEYPNTIFSNSLPDKSNWYPPVEGLLEGDSFHTIPGSPAGPFGHTGDSLAANGLAPYAQRGQWTVLNAHLGGESSAVFALDKRGYVSGNIYGFTYSDQLRTQSWIRAQASAVSGNVTFNTWSWDSHFEMYLDPGQYIFSVIAWTPSGNEAYNTIQTSLNVSPGQTGTGLEFKLQQSNIPIPEFTQVAFVSFSALAASAYVLKRRLRHEG